ncbi:PEP-CTERM sorting domain-containing protein [Kiritimatiellota bacterium B12222]|nr:PEP-CTERM sorting domain-containing protein [Kiritimatiellota bacterium B12222]
MNIPSAKSALFVTSLLFLAATASPYASADVIIDIGRSGQRVESGALDLPGAPAGDDNGNYGPTLIGSGITLTINNLNALGNTVGGIDWRDKGDSTSTESLVWLGEDFVKNDAGIIRLTLSGIAAGTYNAFGYHLDSKFAQSEEIKVFVQTTPGGTSFSENGTPGNANFEGGNGGLNNLNTAGIDATRSSFQFVSNGLDPVVIIFDGTAATDKEVPLNGIQFAVIPEPSSALMVLLGLVGILAVRRRR